MTTDRPIYAQEFHNHKFSHQNYLSCHLILVWISKLKVSGPKTDVARYVCGVERPLDKNPLYFSDVNPCMSNPCPNSAICLNQPVTEQLSYTCVCPVGYEKQTDKSCIKKTPQPDKKCDSNTCMNNGSCHQTQDGKKKCK